MKRAWYPFPKHTVYLSIPSLFPSFSIPPLLELGHLSPTTWLFPEAFFSSSSLQKTQRQARAFGKSPPNPWCKAGLYKAIIHDFLSAPRFLPELLKLCVER